MKLVDFLVSQNKWPTLAKFAVQDGDYKIKFYECRPVLSVANKNYWVGDAPPISTFVGHGILCEDRSSSLVTREQYEKALSASKNPEWNGEGLPPVGIEVVVIPHNNKWGFSSTDGVAGSVLAYSGEDFWFRKQQGMHVLSRTDKVDFRPIRSEADRKRDAAVEAMIRHKDDVIQPGTYYHAIYDAIAAGKIPGIRIE